MKISIVIDKKGNVTIEGHEHSGPECADISNKLAGAVGDQQEQKLKAEYYEIPIPDLAEISEG